MRKIGIITDAHANVLALEAALHALDQEGCDSVVHTGDAIGIGPHPAECLEVLLNRPNTQLLMGNHDEWFAFGLPDPQPAWMSDEEVTHQRWTHAQLTAGMREVVAKWPYSLKLTTNSVRAMFCHYPRIPDGSGFASVVKDAVPAAFDQLFGVHRSDLSDLYFYGHHHPTSDLNGRSRYVNPGALGCSTIPHARFAVLSILDDGGWNIRLDAARYDPTDLFRDFERLQVPARDTILRAFFGQSGE